MMNGKERKDKQHIQVFARIRPFNDAERQHNATNYLQVNGKVITLTNSTKKFTFDKVFDMHSKQVNIYRDAISPIIQEVLKGYNCTVFAYGQTGSGKTHTMVGPQLAEDAMIFNADSDVGIIPRAMGHVFDCLSKEKELDYTIRVSYLEIYNEVLNDLLSIDDRTLRIYEDPKNKSSIQIHGLEEVTVYNKIDVYELLRSGAEKRKMAATYMNQQSSRSHSVFTITVHMKETTPEGEELVKTGKLNLVDLAGSENIQRSGAVEQRAREAGNINQSLLTLGRVIKALVEKAGHIPYRESKLTRILQDSLGGKTKTTIIATASPSLSNLEETLSTLDYAYRARNIVTKPEVNQRLCKTALIKGYLEEIDKLKKDLTAARKGEGFYLNADSYHSLIQENLSNKEEFLRAVKQCADFENRAGELQRQCTELEEVYSVTQQDLNSAKNTLQKSKVHLKQLCRDRHIRQELIDKYSETESQHFRTSKEISEAFDNHIKEHNMLRDKLDRFYASMQQNECATDCFDQEQARISSGIEDYYDKLHEDLIRQLQDAKMSTYEFVQQQSSCVTAMENASSSMVTSFIESIHGFSNHMKTGQAQRLDALEKNCKLSAETMQLIRDHLGNENARMHNGLDAICSYVESTKLEHNKVFENWRSSIESLQSVVQTNSDATIASVRSMHAEANERLVQFASEMNALHKPVDDAAKEKAALQEAFNAYIQKTERLSNEHKNILNRLSSKSKCLYTDTDDKWAAHEDIMKEQVTEVNSKLEDISKVATDGIKLASTAFDNIPFKMAAIHEQNALAMDSALEIIKMKTKELNDYTEEQKLEARAFEDSVDKDLQTNAQKVSEIKSELKKTIEEWRLDVSNYNNKHTNKVSTIIDTVKTGIQVCSSSLAELSGVVHSFVTNLQVFKPSGETPSHKNRITYNLPRKISKKVLQYKELDLSSISLLDESLDQSCGRPSLDFFDQADSDVEYQGQFVTTQVERTSSSKDSFHDSDNGNGEQDENT